MEASKSRCLSESPESALARRPQERMAQEQRGPQGQDIVPPSPAGPTCQLPQPRVHILSRAFAAALSVGDHLVGGDTSFWCYLSPKGDGCKPGPQIPGLCGAGVGPAMRCKDQDLGRRLPRLQPPCCLQHGGCCPPALWDHTRRHPHTLPTRSLWSTSPLRLTPRRADLRGTLRAHTPVHGIVLTHVAHTHGSLKGAHPPSSVKFWPEEQEGDGSG